MPGDDIVRDELKRFVQKAGGVVTGDDLHDFFLLADSRLSAVTFVALVECGVQQLFLESWEVEFPSDECLNDFRVPKDYRFVDCTFATVSLYELEMPGVTMERCHFRSATLRRCNLAGATLNGSIFHQEGNDHNEGAALIDCDLTRASLIGADLRGADVEGCSLDRANLAGAQLDDINLDNSTLYRTRMDRRAIGKQIRQEKDNDYQGARAIYLGLKDNFLSLGAYDDAAWAYVKERQMEARSYHPRTCTQLFEPELIVYKRRSQERLALLWRRVTRSEKRAFAREIPDGLVHLVDWLSFNSFRARCLARALLLTLTGAFWGYGERVGNSILIGGLVIVGFCVAYYKMGGAALGQPSLTFGQALLYSSAAFVTIGFADMTPVTALAKFLTVIESLLGLVTFAVFVNALGRRIGGR